MLQTLYIENIAVIEKSEIDFSGFGQTGLYLVNYENFSSLVGHIGDDYFVVKKFDEVSHDDADDRMDTHP